MGDLEIGNQQEPQQTDVAIEWDRSTEEEDESEREIRSTPVGDSLNFLRDMETSIEVSLAIGLNDQKRFIELAYAVLYDKSLTKFADPEELASLESHFKQYAYLNDDGNYLPNGIDMTNWIKIDLQFLIEIYEASQV